MKVDKVKQDSGVGLLSLFDWNMKSQQSKQKTSSDINKLIGHLHASKRDMSGGLNSSSIDEGDYGKSPGVVARLMGLDSLPNSSSIETQSNRIFDSQYVRKRIDLERKNYPHPQIDRKSKVIEKFQTEILPPKFAKPVPINRQKLLSPIKSSRLVSSDDSEVASKIPSRKPRSLNSNAARNLRGQSMNKSWDGCLERKPFLEDGKKSVSLALQAKINVKTREGSSPLKKPSKNSALKQNNQKQNYVNGRGKSAEKTPATLTDSQRRKPVAGKSSSKIPPKSVTKTVDERKRSMVTDKSDRSKYVVKSNGSDVVSFTFTSPISRNQKTSTEKKNVLMADNNGKNRNVLNSATKSDSLSTLLDQKLKELTETCYRRQIVQEKRNPDKMFKDDSCPRFSSNGPTSINPLFKNQEFVTDFSIKSTTMESDMEPEPSYVNKILSDIESMFEDFTLGRTHKIVKPRLFGQLESQRPVLKKKNDVILRRKLVFDCVSECVDSRCRVWTRGLLVVRRKNWLVKEVCGKISGWEQMKDYMVDELVDNDMSSDQYQRWLDFDVEAFEVGVEIERRLLNLLINEAVVDILVH